MMAAPHIPREPQLSMIIPATETAVYLALELSCSSWLAAVRLPGRDKIVLHRIEAGDTAALLAFVATQRARARARTGAPVEVVSCFRSEERRVGRECRAR